MTGQPVADWAAAHSDKWRRAPAGSVAHGFDLSPALIEVARRRPGARQASLAFEVADMETMAPPEQPYDRLVSRLGVMFFGCAPAAFANLRRWLVPGGRLGFAVWGPVEDNPWAAAARAAVAEATCFSHAELLAHAGGGAPTRALRALTARFIPYEQDGTVSMPARVHIVSGAVAP